MLKQTDEASKFKELIKAAPYGIFLIDLSGMIIAANESGAMRLGKNPEETIGTALKDYFPSDVSENRQKIGIEVIQSGKPISFEDQLGDRYYYNTISPIFNNQGKIEYLAIYGADITDRKRSEDVLRESEAKYRAILEGIEEGYYETDLTGKFTFISDKLCEMVKFSKEELLGRENREFNTPDTANKIFDAFNTVYKTENPAKIENFEFFTKEKDGTRKMGLELSISLMKDPYGDPVGFRGIVRDGTERIKAEEALRKSEEKYRLLADNISDNIWILDLQSMELSYISPSVIRITGYTVEESTGLKLRDVLPPHSMEIVIKAVSEELEKENQGADPMRSRMIELEQSHKNGTTIWTEVSIRLIRDAEGHPIEVLGVTRDITQRKKLETQLQHAQKMEAIGTLAGGIAHDFNNLLMSIVGKTSVMLHDLNTDHPFYDQLKSIEQFIHSGSDTTKQLLGFARTGKFDVKPLDLNTLTANSIKMFLSTKKEFKIHEKYQENVWTIEADRNQIEQVLLNLFINAWQAMPKGGKLYIETENIILDEDYVKSYFVQSGNYVKVSVTDTGIGMDRPTMERIFDPFFTTKEMDHGSGLGLASAYGIVKNHNGIINVYSEKGIGSTFNIYLPTSEKHIVEDVKPLDKAKKGIETILFVDDEERIIEAGGEMLLALGYKVLLAQSAKEAIDVYSKNNKKIDLVILDMILPEMNGGEIYDRLKEINPDVKVLLSSGYSINGMATEILDKGCNGFIQKPYYLGRLSQKIIEILNK